MADRSNANATVYIGNLDERVTDRVLYDILIQAGRVVDLYMPRDRETDKHKGFAFAQYESEDIAEYAVKLFSGLVTLYRRTLKFAISGQDKPSASLPSANSSAVNSSHRTRPHHAPYNNTEFSPPSVRLSTSYRFSEHKINHEQVPVQSDIPMHQPSGYRSYHDSTNYDYSRRVFGTALDSVSRVRSGRYEMASSMNFSYSY